MSILAGKRFLTIDDEPDVCDVIADTLELYDAETEIAHTIQKGIEILKAGKFDLVFLDYNIPGGGAVAFMESIQTIFESDPGSCPPIVLVTGEIASIDAFDGQFVKRMILKPFSTKQLVSEIESILGANE